MDRWGQYLFESRSEANLRALARRLHLFRFFRAYGGHANDCDSLVVAYEYQHVAQLHEFFGYCGIVLTTFAEQPPQPKVGVGYASTEFAKFPSLIPGTRWIEQPGHCVIAGQSAFAWCAANRINISPAMEYEVTEVQIEAAEAIEKLLLDAPLSRVDPPIDNDHCVCPKYYPDYFD